MVRLKAMIGSEQKLAESANAFKLDAQDQKPDIYGAMLLTCADESEYECSHAFQEGFVQPLLPELKYSHQAPFRMATLGGHYEWGAVTLTDNHFVTPDHIELTRFTAIKVNSHVSRNAELAYGQKERYGIPSFYCGALRALLDRETNPWLDRISSAFESEGIDRLAVIHERFPPEQQPLIAAIVNARLQARKTAVESQSLVPVAPAIFVILACVTINSDAQDTEFLCGFYVIDRRSDERVERYYGLGDDPSRYKIRHEGGRLIVDEDVPFEPRTARNHLGIVLSAWRKLRPKPLAKLLGEDIASTHPEQAREVLRRMVSAMKQESLVQTALLLFGSGAVGLHNLWAVHQFLDDPDVDVSEAGKIVHEFERKLDRLSVEQAKPLLDRLIKAHEGIQ